MFVFVGAKQIYPLLFKTIIDKLIPQKNISLFTIYLLVVIFLKIIEFTSVAIEILLGISISSKFVMKIKINFLKNFFSLSTDYINSLTSGQIMQRFDNDISNIQNLIYNNLLNFIRDVVQLLWLAPLLLWLNYKIALLVFILLPVNVYFSVYYGKKLKKVTKSFFHTKDKINSFLMERIKNFYLIKYSGSDKFEIINFIKIFKEYLRLLYKQYYINQLSTIFYRISIEFTPILVLLYGGYQIFKGNTTLGTILAIISYIERLFYPLKSIFTFSNVLNQMMVSVDRYEEFFVHQKKEKSGDLKTQVKWNVRFEHIDFSFQNRKKIFSNLSFGFTQKEKIAVVGESGSGKSTLVNLLFSLYIPEKGNIIIDNYNIQDLNFKHYRKQIAIVTQSIFFIDDSLRKNIIYDQKNVDNDELMRICRLCMLEDFINNLPDGLDTIIGEDGVKLSGGERQRVAIARALLKKCDLYVFDEATNQLDILTEKLILKNIYEYLKDKTMIVITHKLNNIIGFDKILVLDDGNYEFGSHDELVAKNGKYSIMWQNSNEK